MMYSKALKLVVRIFAGILVSGTLLYLLAENTRKSAGEIRLEDLSAVVQSIPGWVFACALCCQLMQGYLRANRFRYLLNWGGLPVAFHQAGMMRRLLAVTFIRSMFVDMLPSRSGEFVYVWLVKRMMGATVANGFTSLGAAFIFDLVALFFLILLVSGIGILSSVSIPPIGFLVILCLLVVFAVFGFFYVFPWMMLLTVHFRDRLFRNGLPGKLHHFLEEIYGCVLGLRVSGHSLHVFALSLWIRIFKYTGTVTMLYVILERSFGHVACKHLGSLFLGIVAGEASASLPVPSFMSFGTYEAGASMTLQGLGFSLQAAVISIFIVHFFSQVIDYSLGCMALLISWFSGWLNVSDPSSPMSPSGIPVNPKKRWTLPAIVMLVLLVVLVIGMISKGYVQANRSAKTDPVSVDASVTGSHLPTVEGTSGAGTITDACEHVSGVMATAGDPDASLRPPRGFAVWSSNRFGNHEIVKYDLQTGVLERLTQTPEKEFYTSISPDGSKLVFARAEASGRTARTLTGWSVILHDLRDGTERILSHNSFHPSWAGDDQHVVYTRAGNEVILHDLLSGLQQILVKAGQGGVPSGFQFRTPHFNPETQTLAVTIRGSRRTKMLYSMDPSIAPVELPEGCQLSWFPGYKQLVFTDHGHVGDNAFYTIAPDGSRLQSLLDLSTAYHHLYFPRFSNDGTWLIYGASRGDHEHDLADYDIFLWKIGAPVQSILPLASDPCNDSWPDIHLE